MKKITLSLAVIAAVFSVNQAHAELMAEPFLGYEFGTYKQGSNTADVKGTEFGIRLGGTTGMLGYGFEYDTGSIKRDKSSSFTSQTIKSTDLGAFVAFEFPVLIRAFATYFIQSKATLGSTDLKGMGGLRLGIGYTGLPFVDINFEHITRSYDKDQNGSLGTDVDMTTNMISVSIPLP